MSGASFDRLGKLLAFSAVVEIGTGVALLLVPALVVAWLLGLEADATVQLVGRCFGIALLALGTACWPDRARATSTPAAFRAMLIYNALIAFFLAYLGTAGHLHGAMLWPAFALHALVALLLIAIWRSQLRMKATGL